MKVGSWRLWQAFALSMLVLVLAGCGGSRTAAESAATAASADMDASGGGMPASRDEAGKLSTAAADSGSGRAPLPSLSEQGLFTPIAERQVIKNAEMFIEVSHLEEALSSAGNIAGGSGGLVTSSFLTGGERVKDTAQRRQARLTLRVPAPQFERVMGDLRALGTVGTEEISTQDVTEEYIDLEARVITLEEQERRIRAILVRAGTIEEIMQVERELARIRGEIERLNGRLRFLSDQTSYSTINLTLIQPPLAAEKIDPPGWQGVWERAGKAFVTMSNGVLAFTAGLIVFMVGMIPVLIAVALVGTIVLGIVRAVRRDKRPPLPTDVERTP